MKDTELNEALIVAWIRLTGILKNTRITQGMIYNEAIVMNLVYNRKLGGIDKVPFREIVAETRMLKSLVNRTIDSLVEQGFLRRCEGAADRRTTYVELVEARLSDFLEVHGHSLEIAQGIVDLIGEEDARSFVRITEKISACVQK